MKFSIYIDKNREEEIVVYAHEYNDLTEKLEIMVREHSSEIIGYADGQIIMLTLSEIVCFVVENNKIYALTTQNEKYLIKQRLYVLEEKFKKNFVKINQSCLANINQIKRFETTFSCALKVIFKNGYTDFVSRRNIKSTKERLGL